LAVPVPLPTAGNFIHTFLGKIIFSYFVHNHYDFKKYTSQVNSEKRTDSFCMMHDNINFDKNMQNQLVHFPHFCEILASGLIEQQLIL
jgi:hypothetical protein